MRKLLLATAAVLALASPALAQDDNTDAPVMAHTMFSQTDPKEVAKLSLDGCKNYAINVFNKTGAHDLDIKSHTVFAAMDMDGHAYLASIWCEVNPQYAMAFMSVSGAEYKYADAALTAIADNWGGKNDKPASTPTTTKKKKGHNI